MDALTTCRDILSRSGSSFATAFRLLPQVPRDAMTAFYAYCRLIDDAVDDAPTAEAATLEIAAWRERLRLLRIGQPDHPVTIALHDAMNRVPIRHDHLELILDGVEMDLTQSRYATYEELYRYCYRVASAVGLVVISILDELDDDTERYAELTGQAVQLTNILRDVAADARLGRVYLPAEEMRCFGVREETLLAGQDDKHLRGLLRFQGARAHHLYALAQSALPPSRRRALYFPESLRHTYERLLRRLEERDYDVFRGRVRVSTFEKVSVALRHRFHPQVWMEPHR